VVCTMYVCTPTIVTLLNIHIFTSIIVTATTTATSLHTTATTTPLTHTYNTYK
jgi:hypothetical protein